MELKRVGDALFRARGSPLSALLTPALCARSSWRANINAWNPLRIQSSSEVQRSFTSSSRCLQEGGSTPNGPVETTKADAEKKSADSPEPAGKESSEDTINSLLAGMTRPASNTAKTSRFSSPNAQAANRPGNSASDMNAAMSQFGTSPRGRVDTSRMLNPLPSDPFNPMSISLGEPPKPPAMPPLRLGPSLGRSVVIEPSRGIDLARGIRLLELKCNRNAVRQDHNRQRFHERPGLKRKRLATQVWRRKFKEGFKATVRKVQDMRKQGW
ncbi:hypothetical protein L228DRAFT_280668 [Xylona heveae TC161]|uniref:Ribosomal protein S21 n=1 Tax=Xylona heveae (strain CBS 132557 / TC161) TaxID=1328760 RepID=A0A165IUZ3_XYLHT|nr:hypothetical protein L228DRAFT_280668 [Xylona heveae TC161]KZF25426.1 hypothetical protein L228DRAFT_280668 [Xylona heveae TC161]